MDKNKLRLIVILGEILIIIAIILVILFVPFGANAGTVEIADGRGNAPTQKVLTPEEELALQQQRREEEERLAREKQLAEEQARKEEEERLEAERRAAYEDTFAEAQTKALMYDYDVAIEMIKSIDGYESNEELKATVAGYEADRDKCVAWADNTQISHLFFHSLIVDTSRSFRKGSSQPVGYNRYMTTVSEFNLILESLYEKGYVLVRMHDIAEPVEDENGELKLKKKQIMLPEGKTPIVISQDDVNYYEYMRYDGFADKLVVDDEGNVTCQYTDTDGNVTFGEYDVLPILDRFVREHPDFSYRGAKGILGVTGYEGALGYRTGWHMYDLDNPDEAAQLKAEQDAVIKVATAIRESGWEFASHSFTHTDMQKNSYSKIIYDTDKWEREVEPLLGETDIYLYPYGSDICDWRGYSGDKYEYLKQAGFWYFCNVDSARYWIQLTDNYMRMGRINADGERMMKTPQKLDYFFDSAQVLDPTRPALE